MAEQKFERRDKKLRKRKYGMRVDGKSTKTWNTNRRKNMTFCIECQTFTRTKKGKCKICGCYK